MKIAVAAEADPSEPRVAATPETVKKMIGLGAEVAVQPGAGVKSGILDADYAAAGAKCFVRRRLPCPQPWSLDAAATPVKEIGR